MSPETPDKSWVAGVSVHLAEEHGVPVTLVRLGFVLTFFLFGIGLGLYWYFWNRLPGSNNQLRLGF